MTVPTTSACARGRSPLRLVGLLGLVSSLLATACVAATPEAPPPTSELRLVAASQPPSAKESPPAKPKETLVGGQALFAAWPKDKKPDAVILLSGQSLGFLQPCGCSRPQIGGLERRAVLVEQLKVKGWPAPVGIDLGDAVAEKSAIREQGQLKYVATMTSLREMGYVAVGIGKTELKSDLLAHLAQYSYQKPQRPFVLAGNLVGFSGGKVVPREQWFNPDPGKPGVRPVVDVIEVTQAGSVPVGVVGVVGKSLAEEARKEKWDDTLEYQDAQATLKAATVELAKHKLNPKLNVLIFQGSSADAAKVATDFPQFRVILCQTEDGAPAPQQPQVVAGPKHPKGEQTLIVQVGHKGQNVGVLGVFKKPGGFEYHYQLVPLGEEFITPGTEAEALKNNKTLQALEDYAKAVKDAKFLPQYPRVKHPEQIRAAGLNPPVDLKYVGSDACKACHTAEFKKWTDVSHSHAMDTLEKIAKRPSLRQFDGECVKCHSVGFDYKTGFVDDQKTPNLRHVGCENCHGPGSGHVANPRDKNLLAFLSPWKQPEAAKLPDAVFMKKMADTPPVERGKIAIAPAQQLLINRVEGTCTKCHDHEADPHFDLYKSWPKIDHSGMAPKGGWPAEPPKK